MPNWEHLNEETPRVSVNYCTSPTAVAMQTAFVMFVKSEANPQRGTKQIFAGKLTAATSATGSEFSSHQSFETAASLMVESVIWGRNLI